MREGKGRKKEEDKQDAQGDSNEDNEMEDKDNQTEETRTARKEVRKGKTWKEKQWEKELGKGAGTREVEFQVRTKNQSSRRLTTNHQIAVPVEGRGWPDGDFDISHVQWRRLVTLQDTAEDWLYPIWDFI